MWTTNDGLRVLEGAEAEFYVEAMQLAVDYLQEYAEFDDEVDVLTHDRIFDSANFEQKLVLLHCCLSALLDPTIEAPVLTNVVEAAAYFPFAFIQMRVEEEIELAETDFADEPEDMKYYYRHLVWKPFAKYVLPSWQQSDAEFTDVENDLPAYDVHSKDLSFWEETIDRLADRIFWDRDWEMTSIRPQILDGIDPRVGEPIGLTDDYVTNRLPKISQAQSLEALEAIRNWSKSS
jgi:hypothetical protein